MAGLRRSVATMSIGLWVCGSAAAQSVSPTGGNAPRFGIADRTVTVISALDFNDYAHFFPETFSAAFLTCDPEDCQGLDQAHAALSLPAGAVIESIGVNTATTVLVPLSFSLYFRDHLGGTADLGSYSIPAHADFATDYFDIPDVQIQGNKDRAYVIVVRTPRVLSDVYAQFLGYVEVRWRRSVSDPPAAPTFGDVPPSHPFYPFIEALAKSGVTGGCGGGNYCPDSPLTRGQMAVFLSKALCLHWPL
jgi:hypothetical protein